MPFEEKLSWVSAVVAVVVPAGYFTGVLGRLGSADAGEIAYQVPMLIAVGLSIALMIVGAILMAVVTAASAEITGVGSVDDINRKDERDVSISRRGDLIGYYVSSLGVLGALALTMLESEHFWIANTLYFSFAAAMFVSSVVKIVAYRRGF